MKKTFCSFIVLLLIFSILILDVNIVSAVSGIEDIQAAADESEMEEAIRQSGVMAEEAEMLDALTADVKAAVLGSVYRRRNTVSDMDAFKTMFAEQYERKASFMQWADGYPYLTDVGDNGATLVVKTDIDGWVYIVAIPDSVTGGVSDEYSFMKLYNEDNGIYKKKVWVQGGIETTIGISCATWASGNTYRTYYCLRTAGNESGFGEAKYTVKKFWYTLKMIRSELLYNADEDSYYYEYYFDLTSDYVLLYEAIHEFPYYSGFYDYYYWDIYYDVGETYWIDAEYTVDYEVVNYVYTRITNTHGQSFYEDFALPAPE